MNTVHYEKNGKYAVFGGMRFTRDDKTGYYLNSTHRIRLHRCVYETLFGAIPNGYEVHHIDHDKNNNEPGNLKLVSSDEHKKIHSDELTNSERKRMRDNMLQTAIPAAREWHGSPSGSAWHKQHYSQMRNKLHVRAVFKCENCGKEFQATQNGHNRFCSNACKSTYRRNGGFDDEQRICEFCGRVFSVNKYKKTRFCSRSCAHHRHRKSETNNDRTARNGV